MFQNKRTGEMLTKGEMLRQFKSQYGGGDPENSLEWDEYYDELPKTLKEMIIDVAEDLGWKVDFGEQEVFGYERERYVSFYKYSPAGEDFGFDIYFEDITDIPDEVGKFYNSFDIDEHIEMWIEARRNGTSGVPSTRTLVKDAEDIDKMLDELSDALYSAYNGWDEEMEEVE